MERLTPSWTATLTTAAGVLVVCPVVIVLVGGSLWFGLVWAAVFSALSVVLHRRRSLVLADDHAEACNGLTTRAVRRDEVTDVTAGSWLRGGLVLRGPGGRAWAPVGDRPFGYVSTERLAQVRRWVAGR